MNLLPILYCFIYLSLTSMMLWTIPRNNRCIGASMNIYNDTLVFHDYGIGHLMLKCAHTAFCLVVSYTVSLIALFNPIEHRYESHCLWTNYQVAPPFLLTQHHMITIQMMFNEAQDVVQKQCNSLDVQC